MKWISVEDRYPETPNFTSDGKWKFSEEVLVYYRIVHVGRVLDIYLVDRCYDYGGGDIGFRSNATHWMHIPDPPEQTDSDTAPK